MGVRTNSAALRVQIARIGVFGSIALLGGVLSDSALAWDPLQKAERAAGAGQRAWAAGDSLAAVEQMLRAQALAPKDQRIRAGLAETFYDTGDFEAAIRQLQPLVEDEAPVSQRERALYNAGNAAFRAQDLERALDLYTDALLAGDGDPMPDLLHNLELTQRLAEQQQQEQEQQEQQSEEDGEPQDDPQESSDQGQQDSEDEEQSEQEQQESEQQQDSEQQDQQDQQTEQPESEEAAVDSTQAPPPDVESMTPEEAMRLLQALDFDEEELRKSIQRRLRGDDKENERDW